MSGFCKDCKWWSTDSEDPWGICDLTIRREGAPDHDSLAVTDGHPGNDDVTFLHCSPDFGCNQFEEKSE